jgi:DNA-binding NarL/FixJ family response regulator
MPFKVIVAADTPLNCQLLSRALKRWEKYFAIVACENTLKLFLRRATEKKPEVAIISWNLGGDSQGGLKALRGLRASGLAIRPIVLLDSRDPELVVSAFCAGAKGVVGSNEPFEALSKCIRMVQAGQVWTKSEEAQWLLKALTEREPRRDLAVLKLPSLTSRQMQVVQMVAEGMLNHEIGIALGVTEHTVRNHLFRIYERLGVSNRIELIFHFLSREKNPCG